jgi:hypothetical protein
VTSVGSWTKPQPFYFRLHCTIIVLRSVVFHYLNRYCDRLKVFWFIAPHTLTVRISWYLAGLCYSGKEFVCAVLDSNSSVAKGLSDPRRKVFLLWLLDPVLRVLRSFKVPGTVCPMTQRHIS